MFIIKYAIFLICIKIFRYKLINKIEIIKIDEEISQEICSKIATGWFLSDESCLICNYILLVSKDREKNCFACRIRESTNFLFSINNQIEELSYHFKKLSTPSRNEAFQKHWKSFNNPLIMIRDSINFKLSFGFENFVVDYFKKGFLLI